MSNTLKSCPFCGNAPTWIHHSNRIDGSRLMSLGCCEFRRAGTEDVLIAAWNRRAAQGEQPTLSLSDARLQRIWLDLTYTHVISKTAFFAAARAVLAAAPPAPAQEITPQELMNRVTDRLIAWKDPSVGEQAQPSLTTQEKAMFPERDTTKPAEQQGMFRKFDVRRVDGSDQPGGKHHGCKYFVLDLDHDKAAPAAMRAYATEIAPTHPQLAADIETEFGVGVSQAVALQPRNDWGITAPDGRTWSGESALKAAAAAQPVQIIQELIDSHKRDVGGECDESCDIVAGMEAARDALIEQAKEK